jgi:nitrite reductase/ring-hydroxylating ferredoxin subunit
MKGVSPRNHPYARRDGLDGYPLESGIMCRKTSTPTFTFHVSRFTLPHMAEMSVVIARVGEIQPGHTKKFFMQIDGREEECLVVNHGGTLYAYVNRCLHVPMTMDWIDNQFMTEDKQFILCATHGACYLPNTGECVTGPPFGKFLIRVPLTISGEDVIAATPAAVAVDQPA